MAHVAIRILTSLSLSYSLPWPKAFANVDQALLPAARSTRMCRMAVAAAAKK